MKTTLDLNGRVLRKARDQAEREGITLAKFVEKALRVRLASGRGGIIRNPLRLETVAGEEPPNVDIADRDALYAVIDRR